MEARKGQPLKQVKGGGETCLSRTFEVQIEMYIGMEENEEAALMAGGEGEMEMAQVAMCQRLARSACCLVSQQPDSGFFCEENSSDDDVILKEEFRGVIIKQGCLLKQVSGHHCSRLAFSLYKVLFVSKLPSDFWFVWLIVKQKMKLTE